VRNYLERLNRNQSGPKVMSYEEAMTRAELAASFVEHPYWATVSRMLAGTIQAETEQLLAGDDHKESNRASVAMCRKVLQMPFFDIEQGKAAEERYQGAVQRRLNVVDYPKRADAARRGNGVL
jgi:hypothetical protein